MTGRILFIMLGKRDFVSGGYIFNFRMVEMLRETGFDVEVVHYRSVPRGITGSWIDSSRYVRSRAAEYGPDLIIIGKSYQYVPLLRLSRLSRRTPVLYLMHHLEWTDSGNRVRSRLYRKYVGWLLGMADRVWSNSGNTASALKGMGIPEGRIRVISPGFEKTGEPPPDRGGREGPVRLLSVGSISRRKDQETLLRACHLLDGEDFLLELAGSTSSEPSYARSIEKLAEELGLGSRTEISGSLDPERLREAYRRADILVHTASWEAFGMSILEGMWQGLPVVATDVAGIPELVADGDNGILVPPGEPGMLAEALRKLIFDPGLRASMGTRSREIAGGMNDWDGTDAGFLELVEECIALGAQRGG
ncbi:MAG: hypothetical protein AVO35_00105 [Candidatus Aegiribacteria sp. MLS_C]|nr:MAG: hypothetical protein AVO35_00105 [Candidatus Aegiribacteria sp. MLS_C]